MSDIELETGHRHSQVVEQKPNKFVQWIRALFVWYPKNYDVLERKLLFKLDLSILAYACIATFVAGLDNANVNSAFVSGMKEDLGLYGNELNWLNIAYQCGNFSAQVPLLLLSSRPKLAPYLMPSMQLIFGILTFVQSQVKTVHQLYAIRFLVGVFDGPLYIVVHLLLGCIGNTNELFVRTGVFFSSTSLGTIINSYLQVAAYKNLSGVNGYKGWQWLFIIDGIITVPVALAGLAFFPGVPNSPKPWWFTDEEYALANKRRIRYKIEKAGKITLDSFKRTLKGWKFYVFGLSYISMLIAWYPTLYFNLWLKSQNRYSVSQINVYPTVQNVVNLVTAFFATTSASVISPWKPYVLLNAVGSSVFTLIMTIYHVPIPAVFFAFYIAGLIGAGSPILFATINRILKHDPEQKAIVLGSTMSFGFIAFTWIPLGLYPTAESEGKKAAPQWRIGYPVALFCSILMGALFLLSDYLERRDKAKLGITTRPEDEAVSDDEYEDSTGSSSLSVEDVQLDDGIKK
ncbi:Vitamin H transporter [Wickerhamomyces ciferrii]|uniref:Vitamin H transporter n=1 Tax=Wickerhamomyces ciferrii (strain ATCC 14091 / BCRC 22168 / CBS 111 / JCM 3599 / NBRC 0793 / NRRL Y-1031 F-60-10) TaxID=1206466 RepID=K0KS64_WICCF|nr:Vitamin H transporter [Wickerhamomyces ciferrii]CCH44174.1 Vitamin H transporter [Wickerhamomyces ciferrii]